jgi:hypothetical protein
MNLTVVDHLGVAVPSIDEALKFWQDTLGIKYTIGYGWIKFGNLIGIVKVRKEPLEVDGIAEAVCLIQRKVS